MTSNFPHTEVTSQKTQWILCAFILLSPTLITCETSGDIRLVDGGRPDRGRVEVYFDSQWQSLCGDYQWEHYFTRETDGKVICRQLGLDTTNIRSYTTDDLTGNAVIYEYLFLCDGNEDRLDSCDTLIYNCSTDGLAAIECGTIEEDVRLANGPTKNEGRVEIFHDGEWGTICDDDWNDDDATVVCVHLGYVPYHSEATNGSIYGNDSGPIHLGDVECIGTEYKLNKCTLGGWGNTSCDHSQDAGVICNPFSEGEVRLVNGTTSNEGRVEIYIEGEWGTVCDNSWDDIDASVVCRQLGFKPYSGIAMIHSAYGAGTGPIHFGNIRCSGDEPRLKGCSKSSSYGCVHRQDAGVKCFLAEDGDVRLQDARRINSYGYSRYEGGVEIYYDGQWGSVCAADWDDADAAVVCQQFRYKPYNGIGFSSFRYGKGSRTIHLDHVGCHGRESRLDACSNNRTAVHSCGFNIGYAVATCTVPDEGDVHLVGGSTSNEGRVEIYHAGQWGAICDNSWTDQDAWAVCRQLGYQTNEGTATTGDTYGQSSGPIHLDSVGCNGDEWRLDTCNLTKWGIVGGDCNYTRNAGALCIDMIPEEWDVRLVDGPTSNQGRLEIYVNQQWGTVCDNNFTTREASVVCQQLGFQDNMSGEVMAYGPGSGAIYRFDEGLCNGRESTIDECFNISSGLGNCNHDDDVGVRCISISEGDVRIVGGPSPDEGRVEIFHDDRWGTICRFSWGDIDARVVCRQLGYPGDIGIALTIGSGVYDEGFGPIFLSNVDCNWNDDRLDSCRHSGWGVHRYCYHEDDAGVRCIPPTTPTTPRPRPTTPSITNVRLVGGSSEYEGRLEVYVSGRWGTVCDQTRDFNLEDALVVCRQVGYPTENAVAEVIRGNHYGQGSEPILSSDSIRCTGYEQNLNDCYHYTPYSNIADCTPSDDVGVRCNALPTEASRTPGPTSTIITIMSTTKPFSKRPKSPTWFVATMATVGVSLALLICLAFVAVWRICIYPKTLKTVSEVHSTSLNTISSQPGTYTTTAAANEANKISSSVPPKRNTLNTAADKPGSYPPFDPPAYTSV